MSMHSAACCMICFPASLSTSVLSFYLIVLVVFILSDSSY